MTQQLLIQALEGFPLIQAGDDLGSVISKSLIHNSIELLDGDILVLAQKIVSKAEGRLVDLASVKPGIRAVELAAEVDKDPRVVELILSESRAVVRKKKGVLITEHRLGWIMANAGIDASNIEGEGKVLLLPLDADKSSAQLRTQLQEQLGVELGILVSDSFGRPWRLGTTGVALGAAGIVSLWDRRGETDLHGREMLVTQQALADELASAASLVQGQGAEGQPVVLIRGLEPGSGNSISSRPARDLIRDVSEDMFR